MKSMIEQMTTMIIMMIMIFIFTIIASAGLQMLNARLIHSAAIEQLQSSYYNVSVEDFNAQLADDWYFELKELESVKTRKSYEVVLNYVIRLPLFSSEGIKGRIEGFAR